MTRTGGCAIAALTLIWSAAAPASAYLASDANGGSTSRNMLTYHDLAGDPTVRDVVAAIRAGHGRAMFHTTGGEPVVATVSDGLLTLADSQGHISVMRVKLVL